MMNHDLARQNFCLCGCGENGKGNFRPGHDQRAVGNIVRQEYGGTANFLRHHGRRPGEAINTVAYQEYHGIDNFVLAHR